MKKIFITILLLFASQLSAQTKLDSMLFNKINEYRVFNRVNSLQWDTNIFKVSNHHSTYLKLLNYDSLKTTITHTEDVDVKDFEELINSSDRFDKFTNKIDVFIGENVTGTLKIKTFDAEKIVDIVFNKFKNSIEHNKIMLSENAKYGACSIIVFTKGFYTSSDDYTKPIEMQRSFVTLNVSN